MQRELIYLNSLHKSDLASLKAEVNKFDVDKLVAVSVDLSKLSDLVKNY